MLLSFSKVDDGAQQNAHEKIKGADSHIEAEQAFPFGYTIICSSDQLSAPRHNQTTFCLLGTI